MENLKERALVNSFQTRSFVRTLSYREFLTSLSLALLILAIQVTIEYYAKESVLENNFGFGIACSVLALLSNHIIYKQEHKRQNNYIGRNFHDHISIILFAILFKVYALIIGANASFGIDASEPTVTIVLFIILIMLFELLVALLKRLLNIFKWQIL